MDENRFFIPSSQFCVTITILSRKLAALVGLYKKRVRDIAIVELLLNTVIRASELMSLEINDIELTERKDMLKVRKGKGDKYRTIPLNSDARKALKEHMESRPADALSEPMLCPHLLTLAFDVFSNNFYWCSACGQEAEAPWPKIFLPQPVSRSRKFLFNQPSN